MKKSFPELSMAQKSASTVYKIIAVEIAHKNYL